MIDRRLVTDIGLALLIAFPATLPAAPTPWSTDERSAKPSIAQEQARAQAPDAVQPLASKTAYGRS